jgi:hypothetical protein
MYDAVLHVMNQIRSTEMFLFFKSDSILMTYQITIRTALFPPVLVTLLVMDLLHESIIVGGGGILGLMCVSV